MAWQHHYRPAARGTLTRSIGPASIAVVSVLGMAIVSGGCQPRVMLEAPKDPIVIDLNVRIEHEVRVKVDRELETLFDENPELFAQ